jgi:rhodanese-related sulfurtransferase
MKNVNINYSLLFLIGCALLLVACGGATSPSSTTSEAPVVVADGEALSLPRDIDVQTVAEVQARDDVFVLDVREQWEYDAGHLSDVAHIPMGEVGNRLSEIPSDKTIIVYCASGARSDQISTYLQKNGYTDIHNMQGGIIAWQRAGLPVAK